MVMKWELCGRWALHHDNITGVSRRVWASHMRRLNLQRHVKEYFCTYFTINGLETFHCHEDNLTLL